MAILTPQTAFLSAGYGYAGFEAWIVSLNLLNGPHQFRLLHLSGRNTVLFCFFPDFADFHGYNTPLRLMSRLIDR
jgi:hypothetical protein